jgi:hypothetical protein
MFDLFVNAYCRAISLSHLHCNSNIRILMPGPVTMYHDELTLKREKFVGEGMRHDKLVSRRGRTQDTKRKS